MPNTKNISSTSPSASPTSQNSASSPKTPKPITKQFSSKKRKRQDKEADEARWQFLTHKQNPLTKAEKLELKRLKNRRSAAQSRMRKEQAMQELRDQVDQLRSENDSLRGENERLRIELQKALSSGGSGTGSMSASSSGGSSSTSTTPQAVDAKISNPQVPCETNMMYSSSNHNTAAGAATKICAAAGSAAYIPSATSTSITTTTTTFTSTPTTTPHEKESFDFFSDTIFGGGAKSSSEVESSTSPSSQHCQQKTADSIQQGSVLLEDPFNPSSEDFFWNSERDLRESSPNSMQSGQSENAPFVDELDDPFFSISRGATTFAFLSIAVVIIYLLGLFSPSTQKVGRLPGVEKLSEICVLLADNRSVCLNGATLVKSSLPDVEQQQQQQPMYVKNQHLYTRDMDSIHSTEKELLSAANSYTTTTHEASGSNILHCTDLTQCLYKFSSHDKIDITNSPHILKNVPYAFVPGNDEDQIVAYYDADGHASTRNNLDLEVVQRAIESMDFLNFHHRSVPFVHDQPTETQVYGIQKVPGGNIVYKLHADVGALNHYFQIGNCVTTVQQGNETQVLTAPMLHEKGGVDMRLLYVPPHIIVASSETV